MMTKPAAVLGAGLLALGLAACSSGGDVQAFCQTGEGLENAFDDLDPNDPDEVSTALGALVDELEAANAPSEISDDWDVLTTAMRNLQTGFDEVASADPTDEDYFEKLGAVMEPLGDERVNEAGENLQAWTAENCEA